MRVVLAGLFVCASFMAIASLFIGDLDHASLLLIPVMGLGMALLIAILCILALGLFNWHRETHSPGLSLVELEEQGLLVSTEFKATRVFMIDEDEDTGPHYFVELDDKSTLCLNGQYLDASEPNDDEPGVNRPSRFPCTEFTLRRHRDEGWIADIICRRDVLEPEVYGIGFSDGLEYGELFPQDGDIITNKTYDELKNLVIFEEYN